MAGIKDATRDLRGLPPDFTAYYVGGRAGRPDLHAYRIENGRVRAVRKLPFPFADVLKSMPAPGQQFVLLVNATGCKTLTLPHQRIKTLPERFYIGLSSGSAPFALWLLENSYVGLGVCRTDTGKAVWTQAGAVCPAWDATGSQLVYARCRKANGSYTSRSQRAPEFSKAGLAYSLQHTDLFVCDLRTGRPLVSQISEARAAEIVGGWYPQFLRICLLSDTLILPDANIFQEPDKRGVLLYQDYGTEPSGYVSSEGVFTPVTPNHNDHTVHRITYINAAGQVRRFEPSNFTEVKPFLWSKQGRYMYGVYDPGRYSGAGDDVRPQLGRLDLHTGKHLLIPAPAPLFPVTIIEDEPRDKT